jgi:hypothetical protein
MILPFTVGYIYGASLRFKNKEFEIKKSFIASSTITISLIKTLSILSKTRDLKTLSYPLILIPLYGGLIYGSSLIGFNTF